jgi:hypothetical protein
MKLRVTNCLLKSLGQLLKRMHQSFRDEPPTKLTKPTSFVRVSVPSNCTHRFITFFTQIGRSSFESLPKLWRLMPILERRLRTVTAAEIRELSKGKLRSTLLDGGLLS